MLLKLIYIHIIIQLCCIDTVKAFIHSLYISINICIFLLEIIYISFPHAFPLTGFQFINCTKDIPLNYIGTFVFIIKFHCLTIRFDR